jgi:hypothetical protein
MAALYWSDPHGLRIKERTEPKEIGEQKMYVCVCLLYIPQQILVITSPKITNVTPYLPTYIPTYLTLTN